VIQLQEITFHRDTVDLYTRIAMAHPEDEERLAEGATVFDGFLEYFKRKKV
jgi:hypothetical protein